LNTRQPEPRLSITEDALLHEGGPSVSEAFPWAGVDRLLARLDVELTCEYGLGPLAAYRRRTLGQEIRDQLLREERAAVTANLVAPVLLARARAAYDGPLLVLKGPELTSRYPGRARRFADLDLLATDAEAAQAALLGAGFHVCAGIWPPEGYDDERKPHHHLQPLEWPGLALGIEIHKHVKLLPGNDSPSNEEIFEAAVASSTGVQGLLSPNPRHHAVLLSMHAWGQVPMRQIRELIDVLVFIDEGERDELSKVAERWHFRRGWETTLKVADWLLGEGPEPLPVRLWARYLRELREPTVFEMHLQEWLAPFWVSPPLTAARRAAGAFLGDFHPGFGLTWAEKLRRTRRALAHPLAPKSEHDRRSGLRR
jgi:hypothetical protein